MSAGQNKSAKLEGAGGEWQEKTLGEILILQRGFDLPETDRQLGRYLVIASNGPVGKHSKAMVKGPGVVIGRSGNLGGGQYIKEDFWPLNTTLWVKDFKNNDIRFCYYLLKSLDLSSFNSGSGVPTLNRNHIHPLPVSIPNRIEEQRAIAHMLGTLDDKIELNRRTNETLEAMAQALFKFWFVDFGPVRAKMEGRWRRGQSLPGLPAHLFDLFPDRLVDSELGEIPEGWRISHIIDEFNIIMGQSPPGKTYNDDGKGLPFYQGCSDFSFRFPIRRIYCTAPSRFAKKGETLVSVRAPVGDINMASEDCAIGRGVAAACHKTGNQSYTYQFMRALNGKLLCFEAEGTVFGSIGKKDFNAMTCLAPPNNLVIYYEKELSSIDKCIEINEYQSRTLTVLRDTLLPKLISGKLRVKQTREEQHNGD